MLDEGPAVGEEAVQGLQDCEAEGGGAGGVQGESEAQAAADAPQTVDEVMACLRKELKTRRAMGNAKGFFTFFDA